MIYEIKMPSLGADMEQGKLLAWRIHVNDKIEKGQTIADVETQKAAVEIESFKTGVVRNIIAKEGENIPVGQTIAQIEIEEKKSITESKLETKLESKQNEKLSENLNEMSNFTTPNLLNIREAIAKAMSKSKKEIPHYYLKTTVEIDNLLVWLEKENIKRTLRDRILISAVFIKALSLALLKHHDMS
jgi:pyruvate dehydrogenase E2 component (dihydrolipoamide acetyltransferase)